MIFDPRNLLDRLQDLTAANRPSRWLIAFSGGVDSTVLLHAMATAGVAESIFAIHVDHGLHADSAAWASHCASVAAELDVEFESLRVTLDLTADGGLEAVARRARYDAFLRIVQAGDCLLTAHHEDDQAETLLLNLLRGSGPAGLAGIGLQQAFGRGELIRPLLDVSGESIDAYASEHALPWIEDPTNADARFDRNFLRRDILPRLATRWPAAGHSLRRSAELVAESNELLNDLADHDLAGLGTPSRISVSGLLRLSAGRQRNVLRRAVRLTGLPSPPATRLKQVINELLPAREDAQPVVTWPGAVVRRYREHLYILSSLPDPGQATNGMLRAGDPARVLGGALGTLSLARHDGPGIDPLLVREGLQVRYRTGGETLRIHGLGRSRKLKKLLQEEGIVPWMRESLPLLYAGEKLLAVADLWMAADCVTTPGFRVLWNGHAPLR